MKIFKIGLLCLLFMSHYTHQLYAQCIIHEVETDQTQHALHFSTDDDGPSITRSDMVSINSTVFFAATDGINGVELWKVDDSTNEIMMVKDIFPNAGSSSPSNLTEFNGELMFKANTQFGVGLWKSDGTENGTVLLKELSKINSSFNSDFLLQGTTLYFSADDSVNGEELWKTDGTTSGTVLIKDIAPGADSSQPQHLVSCGSDIYFTALNSVNGRELWISDGTTAGTQLLKDISAGNTSSNPAELICNGGELFFAAKTSAEGTELWKSDGSNSGTTIVKDISAGSISSDPLSLTALGSDIIFEAYHPDYGREIWISDGTLAGTQLVKDIEPGNPNQYAPSKIRTFTLYNSKLYFPLYNGIGFDVWETDGTAIGTNVSIQVSPNAGNTLIEDLQVIGPYLYFWSGNYATSDLWQSDGTQVNTFALTNLVSFGELSQPVGLISSGDHLYFTGLDNIDGYEMWTYNFTDSSVEMLDNINAVKTGFEYEEIICDDTDIVFTVRNDKFENIGNQIWVSDGSVNGATLIVEDGGQIERIWGYIGRINQEYYFAADDGVHGIELWKSDGTPAGTQMVRDIYPGAASNYQLGDAQIIDGLIYFSASDGINGREPWVSDGTFAGTKMLKDIYPGQYNSAVKYFTKAGQNVFFQNIKDLWVTDGTTNGTVLLDDSDNYNLTEFGSELLYISGDEVNGIELKITDGSIAGTMVLSTFDIAYNSLWLLNIAIVGNEAFFMIKKDDDTIELWKTDGTIAGTVLVAGQTGWNPGSLISLGDNLFFASSYTAGPTQLWVSDGTNAGTIQLTNIQGTSSYFGVSYSENSGDDTSLYFLYNEGNGNEIWISDGTVNGTQQVFSLEACLASGSISNLTVCQGELYYTAPTTDRTEALHKLNCTKSECISLTTNVWTGPQVDNWHKTPMYWARGTIPTRCDNVIIPADFKVVIEPGKIAECHTIDVQENAELNVLLGADFRVKN